MNPFFSGSDGGGENSDSRTENQRVIEQPNLESEEENPNGTSSTEQRGTTLAATEAPVVTPEEQANNRIGITPATLRMLRARQAMQSRQLPVATIAVVPVINHDNQDQQIAPEDILNVTPPVEEAAVVMATAHPENEIVENNDIKPIHMRDYLDVLRKELREQQGLSLTASNLEDDQELEQGEIALNKVVLENGITPEELRVLRALENHAISDSIFIEARHVAARRRRERDNNTSPYGPYLAGFLAQEAIQNAHSAAIVASQVVQESASAIITAINEGRYTPVRATPVEDEDAPPLRDEPRLRRQTYSF